MENNIKHIEMEDLLYFNINEKYNIFNITNDLATGDLGKVIAGYKFYELSNLVSSANYSVKQAYKNENIHIKSFFLKYAILDYNACYDYFEQIVYFAFDFFSDFYTAEDFRKIIKEKCRRYDYIKVGNEYVQKESDFENDIKKLVSTNFEAKIFFKDYRKRSNFVNDSTFGIRQWANNIKHQGGFWFKENLNKQGLVKCMKDGREIFSTETLIAYCISHEDAIKRLVKQNNNIVELSNWLFSYIFEDTSYIDFSKREKKFSAQKNNFNKINIDIFYATEQ